MPDNSVIRRAFPGGISEADLLILYRFLTGEAWPEEALLEKARYVAETYPSARVETLRELIKSPSFYWNSRDFLPLLIDQAVRLRVYEKVRPPKVNVFCVGAPRCGTTTLSMMLAENPNIYAPSIKETEFFSRLWDGVNPDGVPIDFYELYYYGWDGEPFLTDFSPLYLRHPHAIDAIHAYNPDARIIVCLRDPVDRALSAFFYTRDSHGSTDPLNYYGEVIARGTLDLTSEEEWFAPAALLRQSLYADDLAYLRTRFPDVLLVTFSEFRNLRALNERVCAFIGVEPGDIGAVEGFAAPINASEKQAGGDIGKAREALRGFFADECAKLRATYGRAFLKAIT